MTDLRLIPGGMIDPASKIAASAAEHAPPLKPNDVQLAEIDRDKAIKVEEIKSAVVDKQQAHWMEKHNLDAAEAQKKRDHEAAQAQKQRDHEELQRVRTHQEAQRQRDDAHRARLTWIGSGLTVLMMGAVGLAYKHDPAFGEKILTTVVPLIGGFVGGLGINRATAPKALPETATSTSSP